MSNTICRVLYTPIEDVKGLIQRGGAWCTFVLLAPFEVVGSFVGSAVGESAWDSPAGGAVAGLLLTVPALSATIRAAVWLNDGINAWAAGPQAPEAPQSMDSFDPAI